MNGILNFGIASTVATSSPKNDQNKKCKSMMAYDKISAILPNVKYKLSNGMAKKDQNNGFLAQITQRATTKIINIELTIKPTTSDNDGLIFSCIFLQRVAVEFHQIKFSPNKTVYAWDYRYSFKCDLSIFQLIINPCMPDINLQ